MQEERNEAIAEAHYWRNVAIEMARQQAGSHTVQNFALGAQCINYTLNIAAPTPVSAPHNQNIAMHRAAAPKHPVPSATSNVLAIRTGPKPPKYRDQCPRKLEKEYCLRVKCKYVHEDQEEMYRDVIAMLKYENKAEGM